MQLRPVHFLMLLLHPEFICGRSKEAYHMYDLVATCPPHGQKKEVSMKTGAAIFFLDESNPRTYNMLKSGDLSCHLELETVSSDYGFHVYFDEMRLDVKPASVVEGNSQKSCKDYVQFGRDVAFISTYKSKKYCGQYKKLNYASATETELSVAKRDGSRMYTEHTDSEADLWLRIKSNSKRNDAFNRTIRLVVTIYKKSCGDKDFYWQKCKYSNNCVKKEFFCDKFPNCGWPLGDSASDEIDCDGYTINSIRHPGTGLFVPSNIPVIIIVTIITIASCALLIVVVKRFVKVYRIFQQPSRPKPSDDDEETTAALNSNDTAARHNRRDGRSRADPNSQTLALPLLPGSISAAQDAALPEATHIRSSGVAPNDPAQHHPVIEGHISSPPSYDEVIQTPYVPNIPYVDDIEDRTQPPPYSPTLS